MGGRDEAKWCEKCKKKHFGKCSEEITCYKCGKTGHHTNKCAPIKKVCYRCNEEGHVSKDFPKKDTPPQPRAFHTFLNEAEKDGRIKR